MSSRLEFSLDGFELVELSVDDDPRAPIFAGDRLIACREIDDAQACVSKAGLAVFRNPLALPVGTTVIEAVRRALKNFGRHAIATRKNGDDSTHGRFSFLWWIR